MRHTESNLQIQCVKAFRAKYPAYAHLLFHPKNEEPSASRARIAKAEGVVAGVADLILLVPSWKNAHCTSALLEDDCHNALAIELKTKTGRQSPQQRVFQQYAQASSMRYALIRSYADFITLVDGYMASVPANIARQIETTHTIVSRQQLEEARAQYQKLVNKTK